MIPSICKFSSHSVGSKTIIENRDIVIMKAWGMHSKEIVKRVTDLSIV